MTLGTMNNTSGKTSPELWWRVWVSENLHVVTLWLAVPAPYLVGRGGGGV